MALDFCDKCDRDELISLIQTRDIDIKPLYTYLCPVIIFICFFSIMFNAILIGISRQSKKENKKPILLLSLNLAITDFIAAFMNGLSILFNSYLPEVHPESEYNISICTLLVFELIRYSAVVASALHLLALAFVHYRGVENPLHYRSSIFFSQRLSRTINFISIACWLLPLTIMITWFYGLAGPCQGFRVKNCDFLFLMGFRFRYTVLILFALPLVLMSIIYLRIFIVIRRHQKGPITPIPPSLGSGVMNATGTLGTAVSVNLPEFMARDDICPGCSARARDEDEVSISILSEEITDGSDSELGELKSQTNSATNKFQSDSNQVLNSASTDDRRVSRPNGSLVSGRQLADSNSKYNSRTDENNNHKKKCVVTMDSCVVFEEDKDGPLADNNGNTNKTATTRHARVKRILHNDCDTQETKGPKHKRRGSFSRSRNGNKTDYADLNYPSESLDAETEPLVVDSSTSTSKSACTGVNGNGKDTNKMETSDDTNRLDASHDSLNDANGRQINSSLDIGGGSLEKSSIARNGLRYSAAIRTKVAIKDGHSSSAGGGDCGSAASTTDDHRELRPAAGGAGHATGSCTKGATSEGNDNSLTKHSTSTTARQRSTLNRSGQMSLDKQRRARIHRQRSNPVAFGVNAAPTWECTCDNKLGQSSGNRAKLSRSNTIGTGAKSLEAKRNTLRAHRTTMVTRFRGSQRSSISSAIASQFSLKRTHLHRTPTSASESHGSVRFNALSSNSMANNNINNEHQSTYEPARKHVQTSATPKKPNNKAMITTLLILGTYFFSYIPAILVQVLTCVDSAACPFPIQCIPFSTRIFLGTITHLLVIGKSIIDPFIYSYRMSEIQSAINRYLIKRRSRSSFAASNSLHTSQRYHNRSVRQTATTVDHNNRFDNNNNSSFNNNHLHRHRSLNHCNAKQSRQSNNCRPMLLATQSNIPLTGVNSAASTCPDKSTGQVSVTTAEMKSSLTSDGLKEDRSKPIV